MGDFDDMTEADWTRRTDEFRLLPGETLAGVLADYAEVAQPDRRAGRQPCPTWTRPAAAEGPVVRAGARWSARRVLMHIIAETAQHAGHADIIRESLDGAKSMG